MPAPIVNGGWDRFWKWKEFKLSRARDLDLDLGSCHTAYRRASLIDLYLYTKFHWNRRNFLWMDGRMYGRTDRRMYGRTFSPSNIIRSTFGSRPKYHWCPPHLITAATLPREIKCSLFYNTTTSRWIKCKQDNKYILDVKSHREEVWGQGNCAMIHFMQRLCDTH